MSNLDLPQPVVKDPSQVDRYLWEGHTTMAVALGADDTRGQFALLDQHGLAGDATPLHRHLHEDEAFYVLDGEIVAVAGAQEHRAAAGCAIFLPRGLAHAFMITSSSARLLIITTPAGFEGFIREAGIPSHDQAAATWEFDVGRLMDPAQRASIEILGPPPFARPSN
jgi:quercetin dioxygenase-like cupin family protein